MPNREEIHNCAEKLLAATVTAGATTPVLSAALATTDFDSAHFNLHIGGTLGVGVSYRVMECATLGGTYTAAAAADVVDDTGALAINTTKRIAYVGTQPFAKLEVTPAVGTVYTVTGHLGYAARKPVANPI